MLHSGKKSVLLECIGRGDVRFVAKIGLDPIAKIEKEADSLWALSGIVGVPRCNSYGMSAFGPTLLMCGVGQTFCEHLANTYLIPVPLNPLHSAWWATNYA